jgi:hypothetical protein
MASIINASTSGAGGVITTADSSGILQLQSGGTTIATISSTGLQQNVGAPAFRAIPSTTQAVTSGVYTKVNFGTETFDTNSNFASSRFTPTVAGYYQINASIYSVSTAAASYIWVLIYKNGALDTPGNLNFPVSSVDGVSVASTLIYLNGSTDYVEIYTYLAGTSPVVQSTSTIFSGAMVRSA